MRDACSGCEGVDGGPRARYLRCFAAILRKRVGLSFIF
jgi:hypothetical protein